MNRERLRSRLISVPIRISVLSADGIQLTPVTRESGVRSAALWITPGISYLHEREHKRELRRDQAKESTAIAESTYLDQERDLVFNLRSAFVQTSASQSGASERAERTWITGTGNWR